MRIGQFADRLGLNTKTIRYYEGIGLLPVAERSTSGYRLYSEADLGRVVFIKSAQRLGLTLHEVRELVSLRERGEPPCAHVRNVLQEQLRTIDSRIAELRTLRTELHELEAATKVFPTGISATCGLIQHAPPVGGEAGNSYRQRDLTTGRVNGSLRRVDTPGLTSELGHRQTIPLYSFYRPQLALPDRRLPPFPLRSTFLGLPRSTA